MLRAVPLERLGESFGTLQGLSTEQVKARAVRYGGNVIVEAAPGGWVRLLTETLKDPMLWFLLGTSGLFAIVGQWTESLILLAALVPFLGMDAYLHRRTHASVEGLSTRLASRATVMRDNAKAVIASTEVVPGDLVLVSAGEAFPADGLVVHGERMQADESALTGEAFPVRKEAIMALPRSDAEVRVASEHWGFAGTRLLTGEAWMRVAYTGSDTLYGEIVRSATRGAHARTPLQSAVANLVLVLIVGAALICLILAWVRLEQGHGLLDALLSAVTLAVAALPEEFPIVLTFFLGVGVYRLAKRQALVRRAIVVENIGRVSCICSDKTGTITEGRLQLTHRSPAPDVSAERLLLLAAGASRRETGDPMDGAILEALPQAPAWEVVACFPFTEDRKRETGVLRHDQRLFAAVKGAPEIVLGQCNLAPEERQTWQARIDEFAGSGHKVIACAWRELDGTPWPGGEPDRDFRFAGLLCFEDPVRQGVAEALQVCARARIHVIMVTGDHRATASAVAREIGLGGPDPLVLDADQMHARLAQGDSSFLREVSVIARAVPSQKVDLVRALQASGEIVAVTGDGVNDVPALQAADIGIAMGERGTRSAREVAAIVLLDDNFRTIVRAIAEGRQVFYNLQLSFQYLLMIHLPLVVTAALIPLAGYPLLYLPIHVVWLELIIHPTALLVFQDLPSDRRLAPATRGGRLRFFNRIQWLTIAAVATLVTVGITIAYLRSLGAGYDTEHARAMALVLLTAASAGITAYLSRLRSYAARVMVVGTMALSVLLVQTPALATLLHLKPLHRDDWVLAVGAGLLAALLSAASAIPRAPGRTERERVRTETTTIRSVSRRDAAGPPIVPIEYETHIALSSSQSSRFAMTDFKAYSVWDASVRWFHWINLLCVLGLIAVGVGILNDKALGVTDAGKILLKSVHVWIGYVFALNLLWRLVWAFIGGPHARWRTILPGGRGYMNELHRYVADFLAGRPRQYVGHNPLGRIAVTLLLLLLVVQAVTGLVLAGTDLFYPPIGSWIASWVAAPGIDPATLVPYAPEMYDKAAYEAMRAFRKPFVTVHYYGFYVLLAFGLIHILAVVVTELREGGNLISAMVSGKKVLSEPPVDETHPR